MPKTDEKLVVIQQTDDDYKPEFKLREGRAYKLAKDGKYYDTETRVVLEEC